MAQQVDPTKVIEKLATRIAHEVVQNVMNEVALEDSLARQETAAAGQDAS